MSKLKCSACGFMNDDENQRFCYKCGSPLMPEQDDFADEPEQMSEEFTFAGLDDDNKRREITDRMAQRREVRMKKNEEKQLKYAHIRASVLAALIAIILVNSVYIIYYRVQLGSAASSGQTQSVETTEGNE